VSVKDAPEPVFGGTRISCLKDAGVAVSGAATISDVEVDDIKRYGSESVLRALFRRDRTERDALRTF
jgi:hypothetical protein